MLVDPRQVRNGEIDSTQSGIRPDTRRAIEAYHRAREKPGGATSIANLVQTLFELYPMDTEEVARESGMLTTLTGLRIDLIRNGLAEDVLYIEIAEICTAFGVDCAYLEYPRATGDELDPRVAEARAYRAANPHLEPDDILRDHVLDYGRSKGMSLTSLVHCLCYNFFSGVKVPDPEDVKAFLTGLDIRPQFLDAAAAHLIGHPYHVWTELWGNGWWRNDLRP